MTAGQPTAFQAVDAAPDPGMLIAGMDGLSTRPAVLRLRAWEAEQLALGPGETLVDVGCGPGHAAIALAGAVGPSGRVLGIDFSAAMIGVATERATAYPQCTFEVGDAVKLDLADAAADAYRSERTYQWLADSDAAWDEAFRVLAPGGRVCVTDTDWGTRALDLGAEGSAAADTMAAFMPPAPNPFSGRRLVNQARSAGFVDLAVTAESLTYTAWDPDTSPGLPGVIPFTVLADVLVSTGRLTGAAAADWLAAVQAAAKADRFFFAVTVYAVAGRRPR